MFLMTIIGMGVQLRSVKIRPLISHTHTHGNQIAFFILDNRRLSNGHTQALKNVV